ncbi:carbohydrate ABC transporter permease [Cohnella soli]|uniref:Carbohydrate ABC transporter permease n=1 Tax=Cohnella soli TaxID=425005 RepID=A0ABW0HZB9_9BACL
MVAKSAEKRNRSLDNNPFWANALIYLVLTALSLITLLPMVNVLAFSFSEARAIYDNPLMLFPHDFTTAAYTYIFSTPALLKAFGITVYVTVTGTLLNLLFTVTGAYGLSKTNIPGHRFLLWWTIVPMLFGAGLIPFYLLLKELHLINSLWAMILPGLVAPFNLILMRNFFWSIPDELEECVKIDGATEWTALTRIILPLSKPAIATIALFYAVGHWNDYFNGLFFLTDNGKWPLQVLLRSIIIDMSALNMRGTNLGQDVTKVILTPENIKSATIVFSIVPILVVYPFLQRYFVKGIMMGAVKG